MLSIKAGRSQLQRTSRPDASFERHQQGHCDGGPSSLAAHRTCTETESSSTEEVRTDLDCEAWFGTICVDVTKRSSGADAD